MSCGQFQDRVSYLWMFCYVATTKTTICTIFFVTEYQRIKWNLLGKTQIEPALWSHLFFHLTNLISVHYYSFLVLCPLLHNFSRLMSRTQKCSVKFGYCTSHQVKVFRHLTFKTLQYLLCVSVYRQEVLSFPEILYFLKPLRFKMQCDIPSFLRCYFK